MGFSPITCWTKVLNVRESPIRRLKPTVIEIKFPALINPVTGERARACFEKGSNIYDDFDFIIYC